MRRKLIAVNAAALVAAICAAGAGLPLLLAVLLEAPAVAAVWLAARRRGGTILVSGGRATGGPATPQRRP